MAGLTISREQFINGFEAVGALGAVGGGIVSFACVILQRNAIYPLTIMALGIWTWVTVSSAKSDVEKTPKREFQDDYARLYLKNDLDKQVDELGLRLQNKPQDQKSNWFNMGATADKVTQLTVLPPALGNGNESVLGSSWEKMKGVSRKRLASCVSSGKKCVDYSANAGRC